MFIRLGLAYIWLVGIRDYLLSRDLIKAAEPEAELNPLARWLAASHGPQALLACKLALLAFFSVAILIAARHNRRCARKALLFGVMVSGLLTIWWELALRATGN